MPADMTAEQRMEQLVEDFRQFVNDEKVNHEALNKKIDALSDGMQKILLQEAGRVHLYGKIEMHHRTLYGDPDKGTPGHSQRIRELETLGQNISRLTWAVVLETIGLIGAGVTWLMFGR